MFKCEPNFKLYQRKMEDKKALKELKSEISLVGAS